MHHQWLCFSIDQHPSKPLISLVPNFMHFLVYFRKVSSSANRAAKKLKCSLYYLFCLSFLYRLHREKIVFANYTLPVRIFLENWIYVSEHHLVKTYLCLRILWLFHLNLSTSLWTFGIMTYAKSSLQTNIAVYRLLQLQPLLQLPL